jgi:integrase
VKGTVKETTYANYAYITYKHTSPALGHVKLKTLTPAHVRGFYTGIRPARISPRRR